MTKFADMHTHTPLCGHAAGEPEEYAAQAIRAGLSFYGASDHFPLPEGYPLYDSMRVHELHLLYRDAKTIHQIGNRACNRTVF